ncbi:hypothetical protein VTJ04DRAFT_5452 [Mycothermus thermophilus]|uniref:mitochondrial 37S ribosomal protein bS1m n=1 Tax=Humicola insolens TaxID=85995 RepID=UPI003742701A
MATSSKTLSPGGALLRASRMFSLPNPIPPPPSTNFNDSTTTCFPTHQVITTLPSARKQGDWGLKRPLPLRSTTKSSTPFLRVKAIDTVEQITDFASAADHALTLRKFQELGLPVTSQRSTSENSTVLGLSATNLPQKSAFEDEFDVTDVPPEKRAEARDKRWKFSGPWLAGMPAGEFQKWLIREVRPKRQAFRQFLRQKIADEINEEATQAALEKAEAPPPKIDAASVTEDQVLEYLRKARYDKRSIYDMVGEFLDLAPLRPPSLAHTAVQLGLLSHDSSARVEPSQDIKSPYAESGPPITHPSAGLSYLRTNMYMENHPIYGPQAEHAPVQARLLRPRQLLVSNRARLGVAGFVAEAPQGDTNTNQKSAQRSENRLQHLDPTVVGGQKVWIRPRKAHISSTGRLILSVAEPSKEAVLVARELLGEAVVLGAVKETSPDTPSQPRNALDVRRRYQNFRAPSSSPAPAMSSARDYGLKP